MEVTLKKIILKSIGKKRVSLVKEDFTSTSVISKLKRKNWLTPIANTNNIKVNYKNPDVQKVLLAVAEELLGIKLPSEIESGLEFSRNFFDEIKKPKTNHQWYDSKMEKYFTSTILLKISKEPNINIVSFFKELPKQKERTEVLRPFEHYIIDILHQLDITHKDLDDVIKLVIKENEEGWGYDIGEIVKGLINEDKISLAEQYYDQLKTNDQFLLMRYIIPNLYKVDRNKYLAEAYELFNKNEIEAILTISFIDFESSKEISDLFNFAERFQFNDESKKLLPKLYTRLLEKTKSSSKLKVDCFKKLFQLIISDDEELVGQLLWEIRFLKNYNKEVFNLINKLNKKPISKNHFRSLSDILYQFSDVKYVFAFLREFAVNNHRNIDDRLYDSALTKLINENHERLDKELIKLLIHNNGKKRFIGKRILSHYAITRKFDFEYDINKLKPLSQYKLWVSIFQELLEPKYSIRLISPLLKSKNSFIVDSLKYKLEEQLKEYSYSVIEELKLILDDTEENIQFLERLENKYNELVKEWKRKTEIKELNPFYTQNELLRVYSEESREKMESQMDKGRSNGSFHSLFRNVVLAKGGGWKQQDGSISKLGEVGVSFQLPRSYSISPNRINIQNGMEIMEDWNKKFKKWELIVLSY